MEFKTKYNIGDTIWIDEEGTDGINITINHIEASCDSHGNTFIVYNRDFHESTAYPSQLELLLHRRNELEDKISSLSEEETHIGNA